MRGKGIAWMGLFFSLTFCGCQTPQTISPGAPPAETIKKSADPAVLHNSVALLEDLLNDEKNLSKILIIKRNSRELKRVIVDISNTSGDGAKMLKSFANGDPAFELKDTNLPPGEKAARKAIAKTKEHLLLHSKDAEFEFQILLTQAEALGYGAHLALVAAENDPNQNQSRELSKLSTHLSQLHDQVLEMLRHRS